MSLSRFSTALIVLAVSVYTHLLSQPHDIRISPDDSSTAYVSPGIVAFPNNIICTWREQNSGVRDLLGVWNIRAGTVGSLNVFYPPPPPPDGVPFNCKVLQFNRSESNAAVQLSGDHGVEYNYKYNAMIAGTIGNRNPTEFTSAVGSTRVVIARPGNGSWKVSDSIESYNSASLILSPPFVQVNAEEHIMGYDPGQGDVITLLNVSEFYTQFPTAYLCGYRRDGTRWQLESPSIVSLNAAFIAMGKARYITVRGATAKYFNGGSLVDTFSLPIEGRNEIKYFKLHGEHFAMTSWSGQDSPLFHVCVFDTLGSTLHTADVHLSTFSNDYTLISAPEDSIIALLFGGVQGLRGTFLTQDLHITEADTPLSETTGRVAAPAGAFRGDSLFAVWVDYRKGEQIYGTIHKTRSGRELGVEREYGQSVEISAPMFK